MADTHPPGPFPDQSSDVVGRAVRLSDFRTTRRVLLLCGLAVVVAAIATLAAKALLWLIAVITQAAFYHRWSAEAASPEGHGLGDWVVLVPVAGALIIGLMARYGSEKIRGHGIPEALEAILLGRTAILSARKHQHDEELVRQKG